MIKTPKFRHRSAGALLLSTSLFSQLAQPQSATGCEENGSCRYAPTKPSAPRVPQSHPPVQSSGLHAPTVKTTPISKPAYSPPMSIDASPALGSFLQELSASPTPSGSPYIDDFAERQQTHKSQLATETEKVEALLREKREKVKVRGTNPDMAESCSYLVNYRDTELLGNWTESWKTLDNKLRRYDEVLALSLELQQDFAQEITTAQRNDVFGRIAHFVKITADLTSDLGGIAVPSSKFALVSTETALRLINIGVANVQIKKAETGWEEAWITAQAVMSEVNPVTKSLVMTAHVMENTRAAGKFMRDSEEVRSDLRKSLDGINARLRKFTRLRKEVGNSFESLGAIKTHIDEKCRGLKELP